jgi:poly(3-hydroxybutyrate) depolymerase
VIRTSPSRPVLSFLVLVLGVAAFVSTSGGAPSVASAPAGTGAALQAAAPVAQAALLDPAPAEQEPPMRRTGSTADGWATYRLADGRVPDRLPVGRGFRGEISWEQGGLARKGRFYVPKSAAATAPLLVSLHGLNMSLRQVEAQQRWSTLAYQQEFVLVWGAGHMSSWNAGPCCGNAAGQVDDLAYLDRLLQVTGALQGVDARRVHLAGYSNGGMLAYRYACGRPGRIAGVLVVAGTHTAPCRPTRATAVLSVHGAEDRSVPLEGTRYSQELRSPLPPVREAPRQWARTGAGVRTVVLRSFGHGWPTRSSGGYDATGEGWRFLEAHPQPGS